jgi:uncharacterized tellurite resistance protein B-like protein
MGGVNLLALFGITKSAPPLARSTAETETVRKISQALDTLDPESARFLAAFAYILSRVARSDLHISDGEAAAMRVIVARHGALPSQQAALVVDMARHQNLLFGATEDFLVTREFSRFTTREQQISLLDALFEVAAAENLITVVEDNEIRRITQELGLSHADFIQVRSRYREHLAVLRKT